MAFGSITSLLGGPLGGFLWNNKGAIVSTLAVAALLLYIMSLKGNMHEWKDKATKYEGTIKEMTVTLDKEKTLHTRDLTLQTQSITDLQTSITRQNYQIGNLNKALKVKDEIIAQMKQQRELDLEKQRRELEAIMKDPEAKDCPSTIEYLINSKGDLSW